MPGRRDRAREEARHALEAPARLAALHAMLVQELPLFDRVLVGGDAICRYLALSLHITRANGDPITTRTLRRWRRVEDCPILAGSYRLRPTIRTPPVTTVYALTAWVLSRLHSGASFRVRNAPRPKEEGSGAGTSAVATSRAA